MFHPTTAVNKTKQNKAKGVFNLDIKNEDIIILLIFATCGK